MKILLTTILSLALVAGTFGQKEGKPEHCEGSIIYEGDDIGKREALCNGSNDRYRCGINEFRRFAIWDGDRMEELFAKRGDDLSITDETSERVNLTLKDKYGDIVWQIKCSGLSSSSSARLQVRDSETTTVRFKKGSTDLWTVDNNGNEDLNHDYCEYDTSGGGGGGDRCDDKDNWKYWGKDRDNICWEFCYNDDYDKVWKEVDCEGGDDRCDKDSNWTLKWDKNNEKCYKWCKTDDDDYLDERVNDSDCHKCKSDGPWNYSYYGGECWAYCFNTPSGKKDAEVVDDEKCDDKPSEGGDYFLAVNKASNGDLCIKGSDRARLRPCDKGDSKQLWELNKKDELVTKKDPHGCLYVDDNEMGELLKYDDDCSSSRYHSKWKVTSSNQIQLMTDTDYCVTYDAPSWSSPDNKDKMILRYCKDDDRFEYDFEK